MSNDTRHRTLFDADTKDGQVALTMGAPGVNTLKKAVELVRKASEHNLSREGDLSETMLQYGPIQGHPIFRDELSKFLSNNYGDTVKSENLLLTAGATHGLFLVATLMFSPGDTVFVEDPTYFIAIKLLGEDLGLNIIPVPTDEEGMMVDELERLLVAHHDTTFQPTRRKPFWSMVYTIPTFNNPTGGCLHQDRCRKLIQLARKYDLLLFADDVYNLLCFDTSSNPPPRLLQYDCSSDGDHQGNVISNGSFSKLLGPGIRVGWIEAEEKIMTYLKNANAILSSGAVNQYMSGVMASAMSLGLQQQLLGDLKVQYGRRVKELCKIFRENLPENVRYSQPQGGFFVWLTLPEWADAQEIRAKTKSDHNVLILPGSSCSPQGNYRNCMRLAFSYYDDDVLFDAAKKVCQVINQYLDTHRPGAKS